MFYGVSIYIPIILNKTPFSSPEPNEDTNPGKSQGSRTRLQFKSGIAAGCMEVKEDSRVKRQVNTLSQVLFS